MTVTQFMDRYENILKDVLKNHKGPRPGWTYRGQRRIVAKTRMRKMKRAH